MISIVVTEPINENSNCWLYQEMPGQQQPTVVGIHDGYSNSFLSGVYCQQVNSQT